MNIDLQSLQRLAFDALPVLLDAAVKGMALLVVAAVVVLALRKASAAARQVVWLLALAAILALPLASAALPSWQVLPGWAKIEMPAATVEPASADATDSTLLRGADQAPMRAAPSAPREGAAESGAPSAPAVALEPGPRAAPAPAATAATTAQVDTAGKSWRAWIVPLAVAVWLAGTLVCLLPLALGRISLWRLARRSSVIVSAAEGRRIDGGSWGTLTQHAAQAVGLRRPVTLLQSEAEPMPMVWGVLRPKLLLPAEAENWPAQRRWVVLLHELAHARRRDCLAKLIAHVACALYWFNPLCWVAFKRMQREAEAACDDLVLSRRALAVSGTDEPCPVRPSEYAQHLLEIASGLESGMLAAYSSIAMARKSKLEGRLLAILDATRNRRVLTRLGVLAAAVLVAAVAIPISIMKATAPENKADPQARPGPAAQHGLKDLAAYVTSLSLLPVDFYKKDIGNPVVMTLSSAPPRGAGAVRIGADGLDLRKGDRPEAFAAARNVGAAYLEAGALIPLNGTLLAKVHLPPVPVDWDHRDHRFVRQLRRMTLQALADQVARWHRTHGAAKGLPLTKGADIAIVRPSGLLYVAHAESLKGKKALLLIQPVGRVQVPGLTKAESPVEFGPVREKTLPARPRIGMNHEVLLDLESGDVMLLPAKFRVNWVKTKRARWQWKRRKGVDLHLDSTWGSASDALISLAAQDAALIHVQNDMWEKCTADGVRRDSRLSRLGGNPFSSRPKGLPKTFLFRTREGTYGILRLAQRLPGGNVRVQYRLVRRHGRSATSPAAQPAADAAEIERLIKQLGSERQTERDAAQQALVKVGLPAVAALQSATADKDAERAERAKAAWRQIEESAWGQPNQGLQARLLPLRSVWTTTQTPKLTLDIRNGGKQEVESSNAFMLYCQVQVDGQWYSWADPITLGLPIGMLKPGKEYTLKIELTHSWGVDPAPEPGATTKDVSRRLLLAPGRHVVRVSFTGYPTLGKREGGIRCVSKEVVVEITGSGAPATQPAGGKLGFRIAPSPSALDKAELASYRDWLQAGRVGLWWKNGRIAGIAGRMPDHAWLPIAGELTNAPRLVTGEYRGRKHVLVSDKPGQTMLPGEGKNAWGLAKVCATTDSSHRPAVRFALDARGAERFAAFTKANINNALAIVVDGKVVSAPVLMTALGKQVMVTGRFTEQQVKALVLALQAGMPPAVRGASPQAVRRASPQATQPTERASFGPVIERVVNHTGENCLIDFDTGKLLTPPRKAFEGGSMTALVWAEKNGVDAGGGAQETVQGLIGFDIIAFPRKNEAWDKLSPRTLAADRDNAFKLSKPGNPVFLSAKGGVPATFTFQTREGGVGILQILQVNTAKPKSIKIRYRMLQRQKPSRKAAPPATQPAGDSRAWQVLREGWGHLLAPLHRRLRKLAASSDHSGRPWRPVKGGGRAKLDIAIEGDAKGQIVVGLFSHPAWASAPVAVRAFAGPGQYTISGLPPGEWHVGAIADSVSRQSALGVSRSWPNPVRIRPGQTTPIRLLVSSRFRYSRTSGKREAGRADRDNLLKGKLTAPDGKPIAHATVQIREFSPDGVLRGSPDVQTDENGLYSFDRMKWPYRVGAIWDEPLPLALGFRHQYIGLNRMFKGRQTVDFPFQTFPKGSAVLTGKVADQHGRPLRRFFLDVRNKVNWKDRSGKSIHQFGYRLPFLSADGTFRLAHLPPGKYEVGAHLFPTDNGVYRCAVGYCCAEGEATLRTDDATYLKLTVTKEKKKIYYGRVLFENGRAAFLHKPPWPGPGGQVRVTLWSREPPSSGSGQSASVDRNGYFALPLWDVELTRLKAGQSELVIGVPIPDRPQVSNNAGRFPANLLSTKRHEAGVVKINAASASTKPAAASDSPATRPATEGPRGTVEAFLAAVAAGKDRDAIRMADAGSAVPQQIKDFREIPNLKDLKIARVHADAAAALAATKPFELEQKGKKRTVLLQLTLIKSRKLWVVSDIDLETPQSAKKELAKFRKAHPGAADVTQPGERSLTLEGPKVTDVSLERLKGARLDSLMLYQTAVTDEGLARLAQVTSLRKLYLRTPGVKGQGLAHLKRVNGLKSLELLGAVVGEGALTHLAGLEGLLELSTPYMRLTDAGLSRLAKMKSLQRLNLYGCEVTDAGLARLQPLQHLVALDLTNCPITDAGLARLKTMRGLKELRIGWSGSGRGRITNAGLAHLGALKDLEELDLTWQMAVSSDGMKHLAALKRLKSLRLHGTNVEVKAIKDMPQIERLMLSGGQVRAGLEHLRTMRKLSQLRVFLGRLDMEEMKRLKEALPHCIILFF